MPIRINLLAEAQAAEELRRKDPVKRAIFMGAGCVVLMALASVFLQTRVIQTRHEASAYQTKINAITNDYNKVMDMAQHLDELKLNTHGLDVLASERFLYGNLLNALQQIYVDNVQVVHVRTEQTYTTTEETRDKKNPKKVLKPGTSTERLVLIIEARDTSDHPENSVQMNKFKEALAQNAYFRSLLGPDNEIRLKDYTAPQVAGDLGRPVVQFVLECRPPEKTRLGISSTARYAPAPAKGAPADTPAGPVKL